MNFLHDDWKEVKHLFNNIRFAFGTFKIQLHRITCFNNRIHFSKSIYLLLKTSIELNKFNGPILGVFSAKSTDTFLDITRPRQNYNYNSFGRGRRKIFIPRPNREYRIPLCIKTNFKSLKSNCFSIKVQLHRNHIIWYLTFYIRYFTPRYISLKWNMIHFLNLNW